MTLTRVWLPSPNYSSRNSSVRLIVIHSSEGAQTYQSLGSFFANPSSQVSSHVGIDNTANTVGEYVRRENKAWTAGNANPVAVQAELCTPSGASASWSTAQWNSNPTMLANLAQWIREEAAAYNIPIVRLTPQQAQGNGRGICQHSDLGSWGGGHVDCGPAFPIDAVIANAAGSQPPTPTPPQEEIKMFLAVATTDSSHEKNIKKGMTFVVKDWGVCPIATGADGTALTTKLGPAVNLTGNQIWAFQGNTV